MNSAYRVKKIKRVSKLSATIKTFKVIGLIVVSAIVAFGFLLHTIDPNDYKNVIEETVYKQTGRRFYINGDIKWSIFSLKPGLLIEDAKLENTSWAKEKNIFSFKAIGATISLQNILRGNIAFKNLYIKRPTINLEVTEDKRVNWEFSKPVKRIEKTKEIKNKPEKIVKKTLDTKKTLLPINLEISQVDIEGGLVHVENKHIGTKNSYKIKELELYSKNFESPIFIEAYLAYNKTPIRIDLTAPSFKEIIKSQDYVNFILNLNINNAFFDIKGKIKNIQDIESYTAKLKLSARDIKRSFNGIIDFPEMKNIKLTSDVIGDTNFISLKNIDAKISNSDISGSADIKVNGKATLNANLESELIDLPNIFWPNWRTDDEEEVIDEKNKEPTQYELENREPNAFKDTPFPVETFQKINMDLKYKIKTLKAMPEMPINNFIFNVVVKNGKAVISPLSMDYANGTSNFVLIGDMTNKETLKIELSADLHDLNVGKIIDYTGYKNVIIGGLADADIYLTGEGKDLEGLMSTLDGNIKIYTKERMVGKKLNKYMIGKDALKSIFKFFDKDIVGTILNRDEELIKLEDEDAKIQCIAANLYIKDGVSKSNRGLALQSTDANIVVDGYVDLGKEKLDVSLIPTIKDGLRVDAGTVEMIQIKGNLSDPNIVLSGSKLVENTTTTAIAYSVISSLTGAAGLLATGLGVITKSWIKQITADKSPCKTALQLNDPRPEDSQMQAYDVSKEVLKTKAQEELKEIKSKTDKTIKKEKKKLQKKIKKNVNEKLEKENQSK